jgi:hypothetical protein
MVPRKFSVAFSTLILSVPEPRAPVGAVAASSVFLSRATAGFLGGSVHGRSPVSLSIDKGILSSLIEIAHNLFRKRQGLA